MKDPIGVTIGQYEIQAKIGEGGMAMVYRAYDAWLKRDVAIKIIQASNAQQERFFKRFERETRAMAVLTHPGIVQIYDVGDYDGLPYLVMEYLPGGTLKSYLGRPMDWQEAVSMLLPVSDALSFAHKQCIIHRDVKPSNLLVDKRGQLALADFGIAKALEMEGQTLTGTGMGVGTPEYMAPEQWRGQASPQTDVYSLGVVLYEMITGKKPFKAENPSDIYLKQMTEWPVPPRELVPGLPQGVEEVLFEAMNREPAGRYADMGAFREAMEGLVSGVPMYEETPKGVPQSVLTGAEKKLDLEATYDELTTPVEGVRPVVLEQQAERQQGAPSKADTVRKSFLEKHGVLVGISAFGLLLLVWFIFRPAPTVASVEEVAAIEVKAAMIVETLTKAPTKTPDLGMGSSMVSEIDGMEMVYVPAGVFTMGSNDGDSDEQPVHEVYLDGYWIDKYEVSNAQFAQFIGDTGYETDAEQAGWSTVYVDGSWKKVNGADWAHPAGPDSSSTGLMDHPVVHVSWNDAEAYCAWAGRQLPTEAEWEKAARGKDGRVYPWGGNFDGSLVNYCDQNCSPGWADNEKDAGYDGYEQTSPVGRYPAGISPYGVLDMAGNVWEWTEDWYDENYYSVSPDENPVGPSSGEWRVLRGGSWYSNEGFVRSTYRIRYYPFSRDLNSGFRCVSSP